MVLDWKAIHPLNGSQADAFEELCAQLARAETPTGANFNRKGSPDAGVECFCVMPDGSEWGWQAKYFDTFGSSQWSQLDKSVRNALEKHRALVRYYVCVPMDRPDARVSGQKSAMERWDEHVQKWNGWAQDMGRSIKFVWWGSSELVDLLSRQRESGRLLYWFGEVEFNQAWFEDRLGEAIEAAGPRYTQKVHVELDIAQRLAAFARTDKGFDRIKALAREIRREFQEIAPAPSIDDDPLQRLDLRELPQLGNAILVKFAALEFSPVDEIPLQAITSEIDRAQSLASKVILDLEQLEIEYDAQKPPTAQASPYRNNPYENWRRRLYRFHSQLSETEARLSEAEELVNNRVLTIRGDAGTGKTHLLCDFARERVQAGTPVVLLLGQWFSGPGEPWTQLLQQLGLQGESPEQFIGALESAAQAYDCRALVVIDALNEGRGREIWPPHLASFLARMERSPWIGVALSVRTSYEEDVIKDEVKDRSVVLTHEGFAGREYDAAQTYFSFYSLEFPSTPILQPEFRNPLFLKTLCRGLSDKGERRIPHGFYGITAAFGMFLDAINKKLAAPSQLDYNDKELLVRRGLERVAKELIESDRRAIPRTRAQQIVDELLPNRTFSNSLYRGLVTEGILLEDKAWWTDNPSEEVVHIAYERFADQIIADYLLKTHVDNADPAAAFAETGGLAFLCEKGGYAPAGLIEALSIQVPELTGQELLRLAPALWDDVRIRQAFLESIVWRSLDAFSDDTIEVFNELIEAGKFWGDPLDTLLTVSTVPDHAFNAKLLDRRLRQDAMAERDAWWSTYLHRAWGDEGPVDRLVDWASNVTADDQIEPAVVDLAAITLAWMLTTSNRFARDRATKALVSLLTSRLESATRLVERFADVNDPYVSERVYAVAYGVAMRSQDSRAVSDLATAVYQKVFASGSPPVHILLRDCARGVIERAIVLGANIQVDEDLIRPPHNSAWPSMPCEDCAEGMTFNQPEGLRDNDRRKFAISSITNSVDRWGDFARYVIGVESSSNWLSLPLEDAPWQSPDERLQNLLSTLTDEQIATWDQFEGTESSLRTAEAQNSTARLRHLTFDQLEEIDSEDEDDLSNGNMPSLPVDQQIIEQLRRQAEDSIESFKAQLTQDQLMELDSIVQDKNDTEVRNGPRINKSLIQRYIRWRVFDLGWTVERFGDFDRMVNWDSGRKANKPERIGKKYQWIAYHEILAYIADHYQYRERFGGGLEDRRYEGPWQELLRDIDPSCILKSTPGGTSLGPHNPSWWENELYDTWEEGISHQDWLGNCENLPDIERLLEVVNPRDGTRWFNANGNFLWRQPHPADEGPYDRNRRELWIGVTGYFVRAEDARDFIAWAETVDFWGRWMPEPPEGYALYVGEYGWSPAFRHLHPDCLGGGDWVKPQDRDGVECPVLIQPASFTSLSESGGFDCSVEEGYSLGLPHRDYIEHLGLRWSGNGVDYLDENEELAAFDPTVHSDGPSALLLHEELLKEYLKDKGLALCWTIIGEKWDVGGDSGAEHRGYATMSGAYSYMGAKLEGFLHYRNKLPDSAGGNGPEEPIDESVALNSEGIE